MREFRISDRTRRTLASLQGRTIAGVLAPANEAQAQSVSSVLVKFTTGVGVLFYVDAVELPSVPAAAEFFVIAAEETDDGGLSLWPGGGPPVTWVPRITAYPVAPIGAVSILRAVDEVSLNDDTGVLAARVDAGVVIKQRDHHLVLKAVGEMPMTLSVGLDRIVS